MCCKQQDKDLGNCCPPGVGESDGESPEKCFGSTRMSAKEILLSKARERRRYAQDMLREADHYETVASHANILGPDFEQALAAIVNN